MNLQCKTDSPIVGSEEWEILNAQDWNALAKNDKVSKTLARYETTYKLKFSSDEKPVIDYKFPNAQLDKDLISKAEKLMNKLDETIPEMNFNQGKNAWIVKPAGKLDRIR